MTGYTVHTGSNEKFTEGWDQIFKKPAAKKGAAKAAPQPAASVAKKPARQAKKSAKPARKSS